VRLQHKILTGCGKVNMKVSGMARLVTGSAGKARLEVGGRPIFELNPVAAFIWQQLTNDLAVDMIVVQLVAMFSASQKQAKGDITNLIEILKKHWLIYDDEPVATDETANSS
jgi:hypothetical protein